MVRATGVGVQAGLRHDARDTGEHAIEIAAIFIAPRRLLVDALPRHPDRRPQADQVQRRPGPAYIKIVVIKKFVV
jgi:hypothetical protein